MSQGILSTIVGLLYLASAEGGLGAFPCSGDCDLTGVGDLRNIGDVAATTKQRTVSWQLLDKHVHIAWGNPGEKPNRISENLAGSLKTFLRSFKDS